MKKKLLLLLLLIVITAASVFVCIYSKQNEELADLSYGTGNKYATVLWEDRIYIPFGPADTLKHGKLIGTINGDKNDKVYQYEFHSPKEWIISRNHYDESLLWKELHTQMIPQEIIDKYIKKNQENKNAKKETASK